jgi:hypothetical protein
VAGPIEQQIALFNAAMRHVAEHFGELPLAQATIVAQMIRANIRAGHTDPSAITAAAIEELRRRRG